MNCQEEKKRLRVETNKAVYLIQFGQIQIEITGNCNMLCQHCRAVNEIRADMPLEQIIKIMNFARRYSPDYKEVIISGGEPLLHKDFFLVMEKIRETGGESITLTTNGSFLEKKHLDLIEELNFRRCMLSVSLDSLNSNEHDAFRRHKGAFDKALKSLKTIVNQELSNVITSVRMCIRPNQIDQMHRMASFVYNLGCQRVNFSSIHPVGEAKNNPQLWMNKKDKRKFLENIVALRQHFPKDFRIDTNDPLLNIFRDADIQEETKQVVFDGCGAAAITFNVSANGNMTPCALLELPIMNIFSLSIEEMARQYQESPIVKNMLDMNLKGKCERCIKKYQCGGCRARAFGKTNDYLAEDPDCWIKEN